MTTASHVLTVLPCHDGAFIWLKLASDDRKDQVYKLAGKSPTSSLNNVTLKDSQGLAPVCLVVKLKMPGSSQAWQVVSACKPNSREAKTGRSQVQGQPELRSETRLK